MGVLLRNFRLAAGSLAKAPGFTVAVVLTLALGIGANSAVFSGIDAVLLRPLPFPDGDRLMRLYQHDPKNPTTYVAPVRLEDWNRMNSTFQGITGYYTEDDSETTGALPERLTRALVAPRFLDVRAYRRSRAAASRRPKSTTADRTPFSSATGSGAAVSARTRVRWARSCG